jgi:hypothetical protein
MSLSFVGSFGSIIKNKLSCFVHGRTETTINIPEYYG